MIITKHNYYYRKKKKKIRTKNKGTEKETQQNRTQNTNTKLLGREEGREGRGRTELERRGEDKVTKHHQHKGG